MAEDDVAHARAALSDVRDQYIPNLVADGGIGRSYGISLSVPTIFTLNTQSLVYNSSQRNYVHSAEAVLQAAELALSDRRTEVGEDAAIAYLNLDAEETRHAVLDEEHTISQKLVAIVQDRLSLGIESDLDLKQAHRTELQIRLEELVSEDEMGSLREHLAQLVGIPSADIEPQHNSIPNESCFAKTNEIPSSPANDVALLGLEANARAKQQQALGDKHYTARPQFLFQAQYGRISPINDVSSYYNLHGHYNTFEAGVVIVLPLLDKSHSARARETVADAIHSLHEADNLRSQQIENRSAQRHSVEELLVKSSLADVDYEIAKDNLSTMMAEINSRDASVAGRPMTPKDEQNARLAEKSKYIDLITATVDLHKAQMSLLRASGSFDRWIASLATTSACATQRTE